MGPWLSQFGDFLKEDAARGRDPGVGVALAVLPITFAILGRLNYFETRRGRTLQKPTFSSVVAAMILTMSIPSVLLGVMVISRHFDKSRYEFDPNQTISVLNQGRGIRSLERADEAVRAEEKRLGEIRKNLVNGVKKLDAAMLNLRTSLKQAPSQEAADAVPDVLKNLALLREAVGVNAPQQLMDYTAPPVVLANASGPTYAPGAVVANNNNVAAAPPKPKIAA